MKLLFWTCVFLLLWLSASSSAFYNGLCKSVIITTTPLAPAPLSNCSMGGQLVTLTAFNTSATLLNCNQTFVNLTNIAHSIYFPINPADFNNLTSLLGNDALDLLGARYTSIAGGHMITVTQISPTSFLVDFTGQLTSTGAGTSLIQNGTELMLKSLVDSATVLFNATSTTVSATVVYPVFTSGAGGASLINASTGQSLTLKELVNSSSVNFIPSGTAISANALVTASDATTGGASLIASYAGNNLVLKELFGIPGFLTYSTTPSGIQLVSLITAYTLPYTGFNPMLFPDCPFITKQSDVNVCLAGRTVSLLTNATNAANVQYFPATPFRNQSSFSVAAGFDLIFEDQAPGFTRTIYVNGQVGDDTVNGGGQFDPFATIDKAVSVVPLVSFNDFYTILVSIDVYMVGNISFPPNTNLISYNRFKQAHLNFCAGCGITLSPAWSSFANDHVEGGISGFTIDGNVYIDFTTMGAPGVNSNAIFSFSETNIFGTAQSLGRGAMDLFHVHNIEMHGGYTGNCNNLHMEYSSSLSSTTLTDIACSSPGLRFFVVYNVFDVNCNFTVYQSTSVIHVDAFFNSFDDTAWEVFYGNDSLTVDTYTIPINFHVDPTVVVTYSFNSQGGRSCGLNTAYFPASCLDNTQILQTVIVHARLGVTSGAGGVSAIFNTTIPNVIFNEFASLTDIFSVAASGTGLINYNIVIANTSNVKCPEGTIKWGTLGDYQTCKPFAFTPTNLGVSFTTDNFLNFVESGSGLAYIVSFIGTITFNDSTYFTVFKNPSGTFQVFFRNPLQDIRINAGTNIAVTSGVGSGNFTVATSLNPSFTTVSVNLNFIAQNGSTVCFFNSAGTFSICFSAASGLAANLNMLWPTTAGTQGDILVKGAGNQMSWSSSAITLTSGSSNVAISAGSGSNNYTITVTDIDTLTAGTNMVVVPGVGSGNFTIATTLTPTFTTVTVNGATTTNGVILPSGNSIKFNDTNNNATITMSAPAGLTQSYNYVLPPTPGTSGQVLQANGDGSTQWIGVRRRIFESCSNGTANSGAGTTAFTTMIAGAACATGPASKVIAANTIQVGTVFDMILSGTISKDGGSSIQTRILINSTAIITSSATVLSGAVTLSGFIVTVRCVFQTIGVSGTVLCSGDFTYDKMTLTQALGTNVPATVDTTSALFFDFQLSYSSTNAANMFTSSMTGMYIAL